MIRWLASHKPSSSAAIHAWAESKRADISMVATKEYAREARRSVAARSGLSSEGADGGVPRETRRIIAACSLVGASTVPTGVGDETKAQMLMLTCGEILAPAAVWGRLFSARTEWGLSRFAARWSPAFAFERHEFQRIMGAYDDAAHALVCAALPCGALRLRASGATGLHRGGVWGAFFIGPFSLV